jgi:hypothetical protein
MGSNLIPETTLDALERLWQTVNRGTQRKSSDPDAEFVGWQETMNGEVVALYVVKAKQHPLYRSTVSKKTLREHDLEVPPPSLPQGLLRRVNDEE